MSSSELSLYSEDLESTESAFNIDLEGDIINNYNVIIELGHGSYSRVWLVYCINDSKFYAMKVQNPEDYEEGIEEVNILKKIPPDEIYINKLRDSFIETRIIDMKEMNFMCSVFDLCCGNIDGLARKGKYINGYPIPIIKIILKQVCKGLQTIHVKLKGFHGDIKPDNILLCGINDRDEEYINAYKKADFNKLYKYAKDEYMKYNNIKKIPIDNKLKLRKKVHETIINNMKQIDTSPYTFNSKYIENPFIRITDFGFYCNMNEKFNESFGTKYYQAPEIILDGDCNEMVDVWALGCMLYELLTGKILFDPEEDENKSINVCHLEMIITLLGDFNKKYISSVKNKSYFDTNCRLKKMKYPKTENNSTLDKINNKLKEHNINDIVLCNLLESMLCLNPAKRISIKNILNHEWLLS